MTIGESLRYWLGYRLFMALANACVAIALRFAPPMPPSKRPPLDLKASDAADDDRQQMEFAWERHA